MKKSLSISLLTLALLTPAFSIARPNIPSQAPQVPPTPSVKTNPSQQKAKSARPCTVWLGIVPSHMTPALLAQLQLDGNAGVIVNSVGPQSPAKEAGIKQYDIITKINGKLIREPKDIARQLAELSPGEKATITLIRGAKPQDIDVTLQARPEHMAQADCEMDDAEAPVQGGKPSNLFGKQLRNRLTTRNSMPMIPDDIVDMMQDSQQQMQQLHQMMMNMNNSNNSSNFSSQSVVQSNDVFNFTISDDQGSIQINKVQGKTHITVTDEKGKQLFKGPYDTDEDKAKVPSEVRERLDKISFME